MRLCVRGVKGEFAKYSCLIWGKFGLEIAQYGRIVFGSEIRPTPNKIYTKKWSFFLAKSAFLFIVKNSEFKKFLKSKGATFKEGAAHTKVYLNGKQSLIGRHPSEEIGEGLSQKILKQLGLK
jgi:mRNA interferase HicA